MKKILISIIIIIMIMFVLSGCGGMKNDEKNLNQKVSTEITYLEGKLVHMINKLNNIDYAKYKVETQEIQGSSISKKESESQEQSSNNSEENESDKNNSQEQSSSEVFEMKSNNILGKELNPDWDEVKNTVEILYVSWITIGNDLKAIGVSGEDISEFGNRLDNVTLAIQNDDKNGCLDNLIGMYEYITKFVEKYGENGEINLYKTKYNLLLCYRNVDREEWEEFEKSVMNLKMSFSNVLNEKDKNKKINFDNAKIIIEEMENSGELKNKEIFFIKYVNLMQELNGI